MRYAEIIVMQLFHSGDILEIHPGVGVVEFENEFIRQIVKGNYRLPSVRIYKLTVIRKPISCIHGNGGKQKRVTFF